MTTAELIVEAKLYLRDEAILPTYNTQLIIRLVNKLEVRDLDCKQYAAELVEIRSSLRKLSE